MSLHSAFAAAASTLHAVHSTPSAVTITRIGGTATPADATIYRERAARQNASAGDRQNASAGDRQTRWTRKIILAPGAAPVPIGSIFAIDPHVYTVDHVSTSAANGTQTVTGSRIAAQTYSRDNYHRR